VFTLFLPGLESGAPELLPRLPALERLLARGRVRPLEISPWALLAELAGGTVARWPIAPASALGELASPPRACLRVEPLGADAARHGVFRLPASSLRIARDEAVALAAACNDVFAGEGVRLDVAAPERWYLGWDETHAPARDWRGFGGPLVSLERDERPAPPEADLRLLLSEIEMLFHAHPVNAARRERGAATIAGLHPWGGGALHEAPGRAPDAAHAPEEPYLGGLRRLGAVPGTAAPAFAGGQAGAGFAWPLAVETLALEQVAGLDQAWGAPLLEALGRGRLDGVRIVTARRIHETRRLDALRIWRRPRPVADLC
jgi:hypothetical protein